MNAQRFVRRTPASASCLTTWLAGKRPTHVERAAELEMTELKAEVREEEDKAKRRLFVLQIVQPGLAGLMDGSVSTLAPVFAAAFATKNTWDAFAVGLAASLGAGISMGFAEALSDDGSLTGRGTPWLRGLICGAMTALGGVGHTLPFLLHSFNLAYYGGNLCRDSGTFGDHHLGPTSIHGYATVVGCGGKWHSGGALGVCQQGILIGNS